MRVTGPVPKGQAVYAWADGEAYYCKQWIGWSSIRVYTEQEEKLSSVYLKYGTVKRKANGIGDLTSVARYNNAPSRVQAVLGTGSGDEGYNQTVLQFCLNPIE